MVLVVFLSFSGYAQTPIQQNPGGWESVPELTDDFNGSGPVNTAKWSYGHPWWSGRSPMLFGGGANAYREGGSLMLETTVHNQNGQGNYLRGGAISSKNRSMKVGMYIESRYKASGLNIGSGFWVMHNDFQNDPQGLNRTDEIDINEAFGGSQFRGVMHTNAHWFKAGPCCDEPQRQDIAIPNGGTVSGQFHTYGLWIVSNNLVRFYLDGNMVRELRTNYTLQDLYASLNTETYDFLGNANNGGHPTVAQVNNKGPLRFSDTQFRAEYEYIRCWKPCSGGNCGNNGAACSTSSNITGLNALSSGNTSVSVSFTELSGVNTYELRTFAAGAYNGSLAGALKFDSGSSSPINVTGLDAGTNYTFVIRALCSTGGSSTVATVNGSTSGGNNGDELTCDNAPDYNGNANSYSPGQRVINRDDNRLYERTTNGWTFIAQCSAAGPLTCDKAPDYNGDANSYSPGQRVINRDDNRLYERTATGWTFIAQCSAAGPLTCDNAPDYNGNANSYSPGDRVINRDDNRLYERTVTGWTFIAQCNSRISGKQLSAKSNSFDIIAVNNQGTVDLNIESSMGGAIKVDVFSLSGKKIYTDSFNTLSTNVTIRLAEGTITSGFYIVKVNIDGETKIIKFSL